MPPPVCTKCCVQRGSQISGVEVIRRALKGFSLHLLATAVAQFKENGADRGAWTTFV